MTVGEPFVLSCCTEQGCFNLMPDVSIAAEMVSVLRVLYSLFLGWGTEEAYILGKFQKGTYLWPRIYRHYGHTLPRPGAGSGLMSYFLQCSEGWSQAPDCSVQPGHWTRSGSPR